jgi:hypothetical protein
MSSMQRGLGRRQAARHDLADLAQRAAEHVHQDHAGALRHRQPHEGTQAGAGYLAAGHGIELVGHRLHLLHRAERFLPVAPAQEIERGVVRNAKQPAFRIFNGIADLAGGSIRLHRLDQRILQHILAVDHGADHARAIAMQFWTHRGHQACNVGAR